MFKTIITFAALATLAATAIAPAYAYVSLNGGGNNGANENGWSNGGGENGANENGWTNGGTENGEFINGGGANGSGPNGSGPNGSGPNGGGTNGGNTNGAAGGSSTLSILAIELPPETR